MRGKGIYSRRIISFCGITPACAGKSSATLHSPQAYWDHPRMCGEKKERGTFDGKVVGSPPHVRGKVPCFRPDYHNTRITPACAGKSLYHIPNGGKREDHPRMCGEKCHSNLCHYPLSGSPPHVRGKVRRRSAIVICVRITPACAGKRYYHITY